MCSRRRCRRYGARVAYATERHPESAQANEAAMLSACLFKPTTCRLQRSGVSELTKGYQSSQSLACGDLRPAPFHFPEGFSKVAFLGANQQRAYLCAWRGMGELAWLPSRAS